MLGPIEETGAEALEKLGPTAAAGVAAAMAAVGLFLVPLRQAIVRRLLHRSELAPPTFRWEDLLVVLALFVVVAGGVVPMIGSFLVTGEWQPSEENRERLENAGFLIQALLTALTFLPICVYIAWVSSRRAHGAATLGVHDLAPSKVPFGRSAVAVLSFAFAMPLVFGMNLLTSAVYFAQTGELPVQEVASAISEEIDSAPWRVALFAVVLIPFLEEVLFRGFLLELLRDKLGLVAGVVISSGLFALAHGQIAAPAIFVLALVLAVVKLRTRSLFAAWLVHALNNGSSLVMQQFGMPQ